MNLPQHPHPDKAIRHAHRNRQFWTDVDQVLTAAEERGLRSIDIFSLRLLQRKTLDIRLEHDPNPPTLADQTFDGYDVVHDRADLPAVPPDPADDPTPDEYSLATDWPSDAP